MLAHIRVKYVKLKSHIIAIKYIYREIYLAIKILRLIIL